MNGAGGDGGSLSVVSADREAKRELERRVAALDARYQVLPIEISSRGLHVTGAISPE